MVTDTLTTDPLRTASAFGSAYAMCDRSALDGLLDPAVRMRALVRGELIELHSREGVIEDLCDFLERYDGHDVLELRVALAGDRALVANRWRLRKGPASWSLDFYELCEVRDGRIKRIDCVCSGPVHESAKGA